MITFFIKVQNDKSFFAKTEKEVRFKKFSTRIAGNLIMKMNLFEDVY